MNIGLHSSAGLVQYLTDIETEKYEDVSQLYHILLHIYSLECNLNSSLVYYLYIYWTITFTVITILFFDFTALRCDIKKQVYKKGC